MAEEERGEDSDELPSALDKAKERAGMDDDSDELPTARERALERAERFTEIEDEVKERLEEEAERKEEEIEDTAEEKKEELDEEAEEEKDEIEDEGEDWKEKVKRGSKKAAAKGVKGAGKAAAGAGKAAAAAAGGAAGAAKKAYAKRKGSKSPLSSLRNALERKSRKTSSYSGGGSKPLVGVFWLTLLFHLVDGLLYGFALDMTLTRVVVYSTISLYAWMRYKDTTFVVLSLIEVLVPVGLIEADAFLPDPVMSILLPLWLSMPIFALYISLNYRRKSTFFDWWLAAWLLILLWQLITQGLAPVFPNLSGQLDVWGMLESFGDMLITSVEDVWTILAEGVGSIGVTVERGVNYATGGYYKSVVEQQQGEPVGLRIEQIRVPSDIYYEGQEVYLWADIRGKSFEDTITVYPSCSAETGVEGKTVPSEFSVFEEGAESVQCKFDSLPPGDHRVRFSAGFNFHTWSYVTYTFVDQQTKLNFLQQDKNINRELNIDSSLKPIYTPGPVSIGMSSDIPQPVGVGEDGVNTPFGVTLENRWTEGEIREVKEFLVLIPEEFALQNCDLTPTEERISAPRCSEGEDRCAENMVGYRFGNVETPRRFTSITCRMTLADGMGAGDVIPPGQQKAQKTFVVKAKYDYQLTEYDRVEVRESEE